MNTILQLENLSGLGGPAGVEDRLAFTLRPGDLRFVESAYDACSLTLLKAITGQTHSTVTGSLMGHQVNRISSRIRRDLLRRIGWLDERATIEASYTVSEFISLPLRIAGHSTSRSQNLTRSMLSRLGLTMSMNRRIHELQTNQQRLVLLAQAVVKSPLLVLADINDDEFDRNAVIPEIRRHCSHGGAALIFVPRVSARSENDYRMTGHEALSEKL